MGNRSTAWLGAVLTAGLCLALDGGASARSASPGTQAETYQALLDAARARVEDLEYQHALELYERALRLAPDTSQRLWTEFRIADTRWRAAAQRDDHDTIERARVALQRLAELPAANVGMLRAELHESLADSYWLTDSWWSGPDPLESYRAALALWADSSDIDAARARFLQIVWRIGQPMLDNDYYSYADESDFSVDPVDLFEEAVQIAESEDDRARAQLLAAKALTSRLWAHDVPAKILRASEASVEISAGTAWRDDALYLAGNWMENHGLATRFDQEEERWIYEPEPGRALAYYQRILDEFAETSSYSEKAREAIARLSLNEIEIGAPHTYLPGSQVLIDLAWRNLERVDLALHRLDIVPRLTETADAAAHGGWLASLDLSPASLETKWSVQTDERRPGHRGHRGIVVPEPLAAGTYVVEASASSSQGPIRARAIVVVSDAVLVLRRSANEVLAFLCDAKTGAPIADAPIALHARQGDRGGWQLVAREDTTDDAGLASFRVPGGTHWRSVFAAAGNPDRPAIAVSSPWRWRRDADDWRIYAFSDRPVYRPGERVHWKTTIRRLVEGIFMTPGGQELSYEIRSPQDAVIDEGSLALNEYGSTWGDLTLDSDAPLGEYSLTIYRGPNGAGYLDSVSLFRIEEYRLPSFRVTLDASTVEPRTFGDDIEVSLHAEYYSGGPVAGATIEFSVNQTHYEHVRTDRWDYDWFDEPGSDRRWRYVPGDGAVVHRQTLTTGADGRATLTFKTPSVSARDLEYEFNVWVTDASRRSVRSETRFRVSRQLAFVSAEVPGKILRAGETATVNFIAVDANNNDAAAAGTVAVIREATEQEPSTTVLERELTVRGARGQPFEFVPERSGAYTIRFRGVDGDAHDVEAATSVWVFDSDLSVPLDAGDGLILLTDAERYRTGDTARVLVGSRSGSQHVLLTVETDEIVDRRLVALRAPLELIELELELHHAPNVHVVATAVDDYRIRGAGRELIVIPESEFLDVELVAAEENYLPGESGEISVSVRDADGQPVVGEVALTVFDDAVTYFVDVRDEDPRRHFYGTRRESEILGTSSFARGRFADLHLVGGRLRDRMAPPPRERDDGDGTTVTKYYMPSAPAPEAGRWSYDGADASRALGYLGTPMYYDFDSFAMATGSSPRVEVTHTGTGSRASDVRREFRTTALWIPDLRTDSAGTATVFVPYPDTLTTWRAVARVATVVSEFGTASASTRTSKPLVARAQMPRFLVAGDHATVSAVVTNTTGRPIDAAATLAIDRREPEPYEGQLVSLDDGATGRADWAVDASSPELWSVTAGATGAGQEDAVLELLPVLDHGLEQLASTTTTLRADEATAVLDLPQSHRPRSLNASLRVTPSLAAGLVEALPYLVEFPYGCIEQTVSRFVPAVVTAGTVKHLGLDPEAVVAYVARSDQDSGSPRPSPHDTHLRELGAVIDAGLARLRDGHNGGWGWWPDQEPDPFMTGYVLWSLLLAGDAGVEIEGYLLSGGAEYLYRALGRGGLDLEIQAWTLHAIAAYEVRAAGNDDYDIYADEAELQAFRNTRDAALESAFERRAELTPYSLALLALAANDLGRTDEAGALVQQLAAMSTVVPLDAPADSSNAAPGVYWGAALGWRRWDHGAVESTAFALRALLAVAPDHALIPRAANWLVLNRRGARWSNTRDTAITVLALNEYLAASRELQTDTSVRLTIDDDLLAETEIQGARFLRGSYRFPISPEMLTPGPNVVRLQRLGGDGPVYVSAEATFVTDEDPVSARSNGLSIERAYHRLTPRQTLLNGIVHDSTPLGTNDTVATGERIEVVLTVETANDVEYVLIEDLKAAGLEPVDVLSGGLEIIGLEGSEGQPDRRGETLWSHSELRDRKVAIFASELPRGRWEIRYRMRAETPGRFHALPPTIGAMYVPELRGNGTETILEIESR